MGKTYRWGILGAGHIAQKFTEDLRLLPNASIHAVGSHSRERADAFARRNGIPCAYGSYEALCTDPAVDVIYIASYSAYHYPDTLLCLRHKKHVLCEKPVAINRTQFEEMIACARENGRFFMEALWTRFLPSFRAAKEIVTTGSIGEPQLIESDFRILIPEQRAPRLHDPLRGGGSLLDIGIYPVFSALEFGGEPEEINAEATLNSSGIDTECSVTIHHAKGVRSVCTSSITTTGSNELIVHGSRGVLRLNRFWHTPTTVDYTAGSATERRFTSEGPGYGYQFEAREVMHCLDEGRYESALWSWEHSRRLITTLDRIRTLTGIRYPEEIEALQPPR